jgi:hypothetical protein
MQGMGVWKYTGQFKEAMQSEDECEADVARKRDSSDIWDMVRAWRGAWWFPQHPGTYAYTGAHFLFLTRRLLAGNI